MKLSTLAALAALASAPLPSTKGDAYVQNQQGPAPCAACGGSGKVAIDCDGSLGYATCGRCQRGIGSTPPVAEAVVTPMPKIKPSEVEVSLAVGVDTKARQVTLDFESADSHGKPLKIRVHFEERELADFCLSLVSAGQSLKNGKQPDKPSAIHLPHRNGATAPTLRFPRPK